MKKFVFIYNKSSKIKKRNKCHTPGVVITNFYLFELLTFIGENITRFVFLSQFKINFRVVKTHMLRQTACYLAYKTKYESFFNLHQTVLT